MKRHYDKKYKPISFKVGDIIRLRLHKGYRIPGLVSKKLGLQLIRPFEVLERIKNMAYRLKLPPHMRIHDVISITHLEPIPHTVTDRDLYRRVASLPPPVIINGEEEYEIERITDKKTAKYGRGSRIEYRVRWKGYGAHDDLWLPKRDLLYAPELIEEFKRRRGDMEALPGSAD